MSCFTPFAALVLNWTTGPITIDVEFPYPDALLGVWVEAQGVLSWEVTYTNAGDQISPPSARLGVELVPFDNFVSATDANEASPWSRFLQVPGDRFQPSPFEELTGDEVIDTGSLLQRVVDTLMVAPDSVPACRWAEHMLKRFEVTKKLYSAYTPRLRPASDSYDNLKNYALLAAALALAHHSNNNLKLLNGLLKLNDLLSTQTIIAVEELLLALSAMEIELKVITQLKNSHGIDQ